MRLLSSLLLLVFYSIGARLVLVRQEDAATALVEWGHTWPGTTREVTVTANGEYSMLKTIHRYL